METNIHTVTSIDAGEKELNEIGERKYWVRHIIITNEDFEGNEHRYELTLFSDEENGLDIK